MEIPRWITVFVLGGAALVIILVPIKVLWELTRGSRERLRRLQDLASRMRERFGEVAVDRALLGPHRVHFEHEGRAATLVVHEKEAVELRLEPKVAPVVHAVIRSRARFAPPWALLWESARFLGRVPVHDPLIDESLEIFASETLGGYLRELVQQGISAGAKPTGITESLVVLRRLPGVEGFELRVSPSGGFRFHFRLRAEDLLFRPDELESAVHHAFRIHDLLLI